MRVLITRAENGYVLKLQYDDDRTQVHVFEGDDVTSTLGLLQHLSSEFCPGGRYDARRIYVVDLPGDKYEGELTANQRATADWMSGYVK